jgi:hypothetical protein
MVGYERVQEIEESELATKRTLEKCQSAYFEHLRRRRIRAKSNSQEILVSSSVRHVVLKSRSPVFEFSTHNPLPITIHVAQQKKLAKKIDN